MAGCEQLMNNATRRIAARAQLNRILVVVALAAMLPAVALTERLRRGAGRKVAVTAIRTVARMCGVSIEVPNVPLSEPGTFYVCVANHSSPLDIPAVLLACPDARFVAAAELFRIPLLAGAMKALDTIPLERRDPILARQQLADFAKAEHAGSSRVVIFPEGGIAPSGTRLPFKSGAFALAIQTGASVLPIAIHGTDLVLPPGKFLAARPGHVRVDLLTPISTVDLSVEDRGALRDAARESMSSALDQSI